MMVLKLEARNVIGSGWKLFAEISNSVDCAEYTLKKGFQPVLIGFAPFIQFEPKEWDEMIGKLYAEIAETWNRTQGAKNTEQLITPDNSNCR